MRAIYPVRAYSSTTCACRDVNHLTKAAGKAFAEQDFFNAFVMYKLLSEKQPHIANVCPTYLTK